MMVTAQWSLVEIILVHARADIMERTVKQVLLESILTLSIDF